MTKNVHDTVTGDRYISYWQSQSWQHVGVCSNRSAPNALLSTRLCSRVPWVQELQTQHKTVWRQHGRAPRTLRPNPSKKTTQTPRTQHNICPAYSSRHFCRAPHLAHAVRLACPTRGHLARHVHLPRHAVPSDRSPWHAITPWLHTPHRRPCWRPCCAARASDTWVPRDPTLLLQLLVLLHLLLVLPLQCCLLLHLPGEVCRHLLLLCCCRTKARHAHSLLLHRVHGWPHVACHCCRHLLLVLHRCCMLGQDHASRWAAKCKVRKQVL